MTTRRYYPRVWDGDPRDYLDPAYASSISDEAVDNWKQKHVCLCGCGEETKLRTGVYKAANGLVPSRTYHFFAKYHQWRISSVRVGKKNTAAQNRNIGKAMSERAISSVGVAMVIEAYIEQTGMNKQDVAALCGIHRAMVYGILGGQQPRIRKTTAYKILTALGEPVRKDVFTEEFRRVS